MPVSIGKLAALSISLLIAITILTTGAGLYVLQNHYQGLKQRHTIEARDLVQNAAIVLRDRIRFYQGMPQLIPGVPEAGDLAHDSGISLRSGAALVILEGMMRPDDRFAVVDEDGRETLSIGKPAGPSELGIHEARIADTPWRLVLYRPPPRMYSPLAGLAILDTLILLVVAILVVATVRIVQARLRSDLSSVNSALEHALAGGYEARNVPLAIDEVAVLFPQIEQLAHKIRHQDEKLRHQSLSDPLTGLFNRHYFDLMLAHLHEQSERQLPATLAIINLNDFAQINEERGHDDGDRILQHMTRYLLSRVRATDIVVRLGGDEFGLLLTNMAGTMLDDWLAALVHDYDHQALEDGEDGRLFCQFSVGVAQIDTQVYAVPSAVFNAAHGAMYAVKQRRQVAHSRYAIARPGNVKTLPQLQEAL